MLEKIKLVGAKIPSPTIVNTRSYIVVYQHNSMMAQTQVEAESVDHVIDACTGRFPTRDIICIIEKSKIFCTKWLQSQISVLK